MSMRKLFVFFYIVAVGLFASLLLTLVISLSAPC